MVRSKFHNNLFHKIFFSGYGDFFTRFVDNETSILKIQKHCKGVIDRIIEESNGKFTKQSKL